MKRAQIVALSDEGYSPVEIARNLQKNMKIGHLMIGAKLFGLTKVTLR